jgi:PTS system D-glucosamine-specific IIC component
MKAFAKLQKIGKALMTPVAILPAAGLLLAFGQPNVLNSSLMASAGNVIFANLPLLFAVGSAIGLAGGDGVAGLASIVSILIMNTVMGITTGAADQIASGSKAYAMVLGIPTLQTGVFGGLVAGIIAAAMYNKFYKIELPAYLGFFAGKRFVPIATAAVSFIVGLAFPYIWKPIQAGLAALSVIGTNPTAFSTFAFGLIERSLIPFGLHHIFYSPFWFEFGEWTNAAGQVFRGDQAIFFAKLNDNVASFGTTGAYMTGKFAFMMFGLPGAALAMYRQADPDKKKAAAGILLSAALTSFLTGITEPIEFSFLFVAPILYGIHCLIAATSFMVMNMLNVRIGMTFSGGLIDFLSFGVAPNKTPWYLVIVVGAIFFVLYYFLFTFFIKKYDLQTPGRERGGDEEKTASTGVELAASVLEALGGTHNIVSVDACITRLRLEVKDTAVVDDAKLKSLGAAGVLKVGSNGVQAIFGSKAQFIATDIKEIIG